MAEQTRRYGHPTRTTAGILTILGMLILLAASAAAWNEPDGFKGVRWGSGPEELRRVLLVPGCEWEIRDEGPDGIIGYRMTGSCAVYGRRPEVYHIGEVPIEAPEPITTPGAVFYYHGGRMGGVEFNFATGDYEKLREAFVAKYGSPTGRKARRYQNPFGARFSSQELEWIGGMVRILLQERTSRKLTRGAAIFQTREFIEATEAAEAAEAKRRREGL